MQIRTVLQRKGHDVVTTRPDVGIPELSRDLTKGQFGALPVVDENGSLIGIISEWDIVRGFSASGAEIENQIISDLMTSDVITCTPDNTVADVAEMMDYHGIRHLPVVEREKLMGIVSIRNIVAIRMLSLETDVEVLRRQLLEGVSNL